jgi:hypothetical protein
MSIGPGHAAEGGYSNYIPGTYGDFAMTLAPSEKWTLRNDLYYYDADAYKPDIALLGAQYAAGVFVPLVNLDIDSSISVRDRIFSADDKATGLGDIAVFPFLLYWSTDNIHTSFFLSIVTPTGDYDTDNAINNGLNYWSFDTNFALTYLNGKTGQDYSINIGHIYNTENNDTDYQTGQEVHLDVVLNQFFSETFAVGIHGFYLKQITGDSGSGALLGDFKAEAAGVGPALLWTKRTGNQDVSFVVKWLHEFHAENRLEGDHIFLSFAVDW